MGGDEQKQTESAARQDDRRELEVLLALAASEVAGKRGRANGGASPHKNSTAGGVSRS
jgi:hypothetical protein